VTVLDAAAVGISFASPARSRSHKWHPAEPEAKAHSGRQREPASRASADGGAEAQGDEMVDAPTRTFMHVARCGV